MDGHVYAYNVPKSTEQQAYTQARIAQLTAQRREQRRSWDLSNEQQQQQQQQPAAAGTRSRSYSSAASTGKPRDSGIASPPPPIVHQRHASGDSSTTMEATRATTAALGTTLSQHSDAHHQALLSNPFELRHGRRYLRDVPYPLPCDLAEMQRQNLRTLLACRVFGKPYCSPNLDHAVPPRRVLELGCGSGYWSAMAHDHFRARGHAAVSFTGVDVAPLAADLRKQGVDWRFVQHDVQRLPWPFDDGEFDVVMVRDCSLVIPMTANSAAKHLDESIRVLRAGGTLEIWDSDLIVRALLPHSLAPAAAAHHPPPEREIAERTATFPMAAGAPFAPAQNRYLLQANAWISDALDRRRFSPVPCARIAQLLLQEPDLGSIGVRRVAIPLGGELPWERDAAAAVDDFPARSNSHVSGVDSPMSMGQAKTAAHASASTSSFSEGEKDKHEYSEEHDGASDGEQTQSILTPDQLALRQTALITVLQMIESFEPLLKEVSGKNAEEWSTWWASMMTELTDPSKANLSGECLELGVWWASKLVNEG